MIDSECLQGLVGRNHDPSLQAHCGSNQAPFLRGAVRPGDRDGLALGSPSLQSKHRLTGETIRRVEGPAFGHVVGPAMPPGSICLRVLDQVGYDLSSLSIYYLWASHRALSHHKLLPLFLTALDTIISTPLSVAYPSCWPPVGQAPHFNMAWKQLY